MHASSSSFSATTWALHPATDSTTKYESPLWSKHSICPWRAVEVGVVVSVVVVVGEVVNDEVGVVDVAVVVSVDVPVVDVVDVGVVVCVVLVVGVVVCDVVPVDVGEVVGVVISHSVNVPSWYESIAAFRTATVASHASAPPSSTMHPPKLHENSLSTPSHEYSSTAVPMLVSTLSPLQPEPSTINSSLLNVAHVSVPAPPRHDSKTWFSTDACTEHVESDDAAKCRFFRYE